jgi:hypothetical protein
MFGQIDFNLPQNFSNLTFLSSSNNLFLEIFLMVFLRL